MSSYRIRFLRCFSYVGNSFCNWGRFSLDYLYLALLRVYVLIVVFYHWYSSILYSHLILSSMAKLLLCVVIVFNLLFLKLVSLASPLFFHESGNDCM